MTPAPAPEPAPAQVASGEPQPELPSAPDPQHEQDNHLAVAPAAAEEANRQTVGSPTTPQAADSRTPDYTHEEVHGPGQSGVRADQRLIDAYRAWAATFPSEPTHQQLALWLQEQYGIATAAGHPLSDAQLQPLLQVLKQRGAPRPGGGPSASQEERPTEDTWDHYFYAAWLACAEEQSVYPDAAGLAEYVYRRDGILGSTGQPVTADELKDYVARFRNGQGGAGLVPEPRPEAADQAVETAIDQSHGEVPRPGNSEGLGEQSSTPPRSVPGQRDRVQEQIADRPVLLAGDELLDEPRQQTGDAEEPKSPEPEQDPEPEFVSAGLGPQAAEEQRGPRVDARIDSTERPSPDPDEDAVLTVVDRYYLAWAEYQTQHGSEPAPDDLSALLAQKGMLGRGGKQVSPSTLRRYSIPFRVYTVWAEHRTGTEAPSADAVAQDCATRGITAQYNKPIPAEQITEQAADFERRWQVLVRQHAESR